MTIGGRGQPNKPGEKLKQFIESRGWTQTEFAEIIGRPVQAVNEIIKGSKAITPATAIMLGVVTNIEAKEWLRMESECQLRSASKKDQGRGLTMRAELFSLAPLSEMIRLGWIEAETDPKQLRKNVFSFYGKNSLDEIRASSARFRVSKANAARPESLVAWLRRAEIMAAKSHAKPFSPDTLEVQGRAIAELSRRKDVLGSVRSKLGELGIRYVDLAHLKKTYVDGAATWIDRDTPVVVTSRRHNRVDNYFFTLMHELAHIAYGNPDELRSFIDVELEAYMDDPEEQKANQKAREWLIPSTEYQDFLACCRGRFSRTSVAAFAAKLRIHEGIVVGRLQHDGLIGYSQMRDFLVPVS